MPEVEVDTEHLQEMIHHEHSHARGDHSDGGFLQVVALTTALLAAVAAMGSLRAGATVNEALIQETRSAKLQGEITNLWAYYQAKSTKAAIQEATIASWSAAGKEAPPRYEETKNRYFLEAEEIRKRAEEKEKERDHMSEIGSELMHTHHAYAQAVAIFQIAIALGAVAALTRKKSIWYGSIALGIAGAFRIGVSFFC